MLRLQKLFVLVLLLGLCGCSPYPFVPLEVTTQAPSATFPAYWAQTQTALAVASPFLPPTLPPPPTFTPDIIEKPRDFSPVLYGKKYDANTFFLVLGGVRNGEGLTPEVSLARFAGEATYSLHTLEQEYKYFFRGKTPEPARNCNSFIIGTDIDVNEKGMVAILDGWSITKHAATELSPEAGFYRQVVIDWLAGEGVISPQRGTSHIFRVDLEGDGTDEVFISATHLDDSQHTTKAGDYSVVLMRKVVGSQAVTIPLVADVYSSQELEITFPRTYSFANFIDLNQDGVLEVVVDIQQWERFGAIVFQIDGQRVTQSLRAEC